MGGVFDNIRRKVYPKVEIDDDLSGDLSLGLDAVVPDLTAMIGVNDAGSSFLVGAGYVEMVRRGSR